jgi:FixJ family two-component response regulator
MKLAHLSEIEGSSANDYRPCKTNSASQSEVIFVVNGDCAHREELIADIKRQGYIAIGLGHVYDVNQYVSELQNGCILLDAPLLDENDPEAFRLVSYANAILPVIVISATKKISIVVDTVKVGAVDFLSEPISKVRLCHAIESALISSRQRSFKRAQKEVAVESLTILTPTETIVARLLAQGKPGKVIAAALGRSENTIKVHRARIFGKLNINSVVSLSRLLGIADMLGDDLHSSALLT